MIQRGNKIYLGKKRCDYDTRLKNLLRQRTSIKPHKTEVVGKSQGRCSSNSGTKMANDEIHVAQ